MYLKRHNHTEKIALAGNLISKLPRGNFKELMHVFAVGIKRVSSRGFTNSMDGGWQNPRMGSSDAPVTNWSMC